jgi:hypothetical protein
MAYFDNALRKIAQDKGYTVGLDSKTGEVIVENPTTKKRITFKSGQGAEYGMGGMKDGYNIVSDVSMLDSALAADPTPKAIAGATNYFGSASSKYASPYSEKINQFIDKITGYKPYDYSSYNPDADPAFQQFKTSAIKAGNEAYSDTFAGTAIPGVAESSVGRQIAETARKGYTDRIQDAIPTFAEKARQGYESAHAADVDALNTLLGVESAELRNASTIQDNLANEAHTIALANYDNIQAEINRRQAIDPNDPLIPYLRAERQNKVAVQNESKTQAEQTAFERAIAEREIALEENKAKTAAAKASSGSGSTSKTSSDISKMGTTQQVDTFYRLLSGYSGGGDGRWANNPSGAYAMIQQQRGTIEKAIGSKLYSELLSQIKALDVVTGTVKTPVPPEESTLGAIYSAMFSGNVDPNAWLRENSAFMTDDEIKAANSWLSQYKN